MVTKTSCFLFFLLGALTFLIKTPIIVKAQQLGVGVAQYILVNEEVETGDIISVEGGTYKKSKKENDSQVIGVVNLNPAVSIKYNDDKNSVPILDSGETPVKVTTKNGNIKVGDLITTSTTPGIGVKSIKSGFTIGVAKENYENSNKDEVRTILIQVNPHFSISGNSDTEAKVEQSIMDIFSLSAIAAYESPTKAFKHIVAALILLIAIVFGFFTFGRVATYGIEAVGRNPLAKKSIGIGMAINVFITIAIIFAGLIIAYLIMVL